MVPRWLGALVFLLLVAQPVYSAEYPTLSGFTYAKWTHNDGLPGNDVRDIVQAPDGYIWFTTEEGLVRFDGVSFKLYASFPGVPSPVGRGLCVAGDRSLWVGLAEGGVANLRDGSVQYYTPGTTVLPGAVRGVLRARDDSIWVATPIGASRYAGGRWKTFPIPEVSGTRHGSLAEADDGTIAIASLRGLFVKGPDDREFVRDLAVPDNLYGVETDPAGRLWVASEAYAGPVHGTVSTELSLNYRFIKDRNGGVWFSIRGPRNEGVYYSRHTTELVKIDSRERFTAADGLPSSQVNAFLEDREGNVWVGTANGLGRLSPSSFQTLSLPPEAGRLFTATVLGARDGGLVVSPGLADWFGWVPRATSTVVHVGDLGLVGSFTDPAPAAIPPVRLTRSAIEVARQTMRPATSPGSVLSKDYPDWRYEPNRTVYEPSYEIHLSASAYEKESFGSDFFARDQDGQIWVTKPAGGLYIVESGTSVPVQRMAGKDVDVVAVDQDGRVWAGGRDGLFGKSGEEWRHYGESDGMFHGRVKGFHAARDGSFWILGASLSRLKAGHLSSFERQVEFQGAASMVEDDDGYTWFAAPNGIFRVAPGEWDRAERDSSYRVQYKRFDERNGLPSQPPGLPRQCARTEDGRLWFVLRDGIVWMDPHRLVENQLPPPVVIEGVLVDQQAAAPTADKELPPRTHTLAITYAALSFVSPANVRFKVRLAGFDRDWVDAGTRREAVYTNLSPGRYRFTVIASNNEGVWNETGQVWAFRVLPAFYQTNWFLAFSLALVAAATWAGYHARLRATTRLIRARYEARLAERTRIARELHDTLLQSIAGASLQLHAAEKMIVTNPSDAARNVGGVRRQLDSSFREARRKVWNLRSPQLEERGLAGALQDSIETMSQSINATGAKTSLTVNGGPRNLPVGSEEHLLRISEECVANALRHANASRISAELCYGRESIRLCVSDDGTGFDVEAATRNGHWGLKNIRDRAAEIGAELTITSVRGSGTKIEATVRGAAARGPDDANRGTAR